MILPIKAQSIMQFAADCRPAGKLPVANCKQSPAAGIRLKLT
ncbi:hypothetical protein CFter6_1352 [Collimonas fungivorans]|uniref:Uncharacterized protein n=1 Tax=Collimonas fungivorans TaxID=158899 RepID=A0A127P8K1_9BURK|nr:hypothetical protein CFter6_1352 [Collimonas fungivorans]